MQRNARQPFVFSDGTFIPAGAKLVAPSLTLQRDATIVDNPDDFDGFRWIKLLDGNCTLEKTMVTTGTDYHLFGHGRHPWYVLREILHPDKIVPAEPLTVPVDSSLATR